MMCRCAAMPETEKLLSRVMGCCKISRAKDVKNFSKEHLKQPKS